MTIPSRVTDTSIANKALGDLQRSLARGQKIQQQISGGKLLTRPNGTLIPALGKEGVLTAFYGAPRQVFVTGTVKF